MINRHCSFGALVQEPIPLNSSTEKQISSMNSPYKQFGTQQTEEIKSKDESIDPLKPSILTDQQIQDLINSIGLKEQKVGSQVDYNFKDLKISNSKSNPQNFFTQNQGNSFSQNQEGCIPTFPSYLGTEKNTINSSNVYPSNIKFLGSSKKEDFSDSKNSLLNSEQVIQQVSVIQSIENSGANQILIGISDVSSADKNSYYSNVSTFQPKSSNSNQIPSSNSIFPTFQQQQSPCQQSKNIVQSSIYSFSSCQVPFDSKLNKNLNEQINSSSTFLKGATSQNLSEKTDELSENLKNQGWNTEQNNLLDSRFSFQKPITRCQECAVMRQKIDFLEIELKEANEKTEIADKLNNSLMNALGKEKDKGGMSSYSLLISQHEKEILHLREQIKLKQIETSRNQKELISKLDELENQKLGVELALSDLRQLYNTSEQKLKEKISEISQKDLKIESLIDEKRQIEKRVQSSEEVEQLKKESESLKKNQLQEIQRIHAENEREKQKLYLQLQKNHEQFENRIKLLFEEKLLIEKQSQSSNDYSAYLRSRLEDEVNKLIQQRVFSINLIEKQKEEIENTKLKATQQNILSVQVNEQDKTIQKLRSVSNAHDALQAQYAQQNTNIKDLQQRIKELQKESQIFKEKREQEKKIEKERYNEALTKLENKTIQEEKFKKDFQRKSAMIIREILNKDMKIKQLQDKLLSKVGRDRSPLQRLLQEEKYVSGHPYFIEFNKSQLLPNTDRQQYSSNQENRQPLQQSAQSFWQQFIESSDLSHQQNLQSQELLDGSTIKDKILISTQKPSKDIYGSNNPNDFARDFVQLKEKEEKHKSEMQFVVEQFIQVLANQIVSEIQVQSISNSQEEKAIIEETDRILKSHLFKLQEKAIQSHMCVFLKILDSILNSNQKESDMEINENCLKKDITIQNKALNSQISNSNCSNSNAYGSNINASKNIMNTPKTQSNLSLNNNGEMNNQSPDQANKNSLFQSSLKSNSTKSPSVTVISSSSYNLSAALANKRYKGAGQSTQSLTVITQTHNDTSPLKLKNGLKLSELSKEPRRRTPLSHSGNEKRRSSGMTPTNSSQKGFQKFSNFFSKQSQANVNISPSNRAKTYEINSSHNLSDIKFN